MSKIGLCLTTTKHNKSWTLCRVLGNNCTSPAAFTARIALWVLPTESEGLIMYLNMSQVGPLTGALPAMLFAVVSTPTLCSTNGPLTKTQNCGVRMRREYRERFPRHRHQRKPLVSDHGMHHGTQWRGKCSRYSRRMRNPQFCVSGKWPKEKLGTECFIYINHAFTPRLFLCCCC